MSAIPKPVFFLSTLASPHVAGDGQLVLQPGDGARLGALAAGQVYALTAVVAPGLGETILTNLRATGLSTDTLTGVVADAHSTDVAVPAGTPLQVRLTPAWQEDVQTALASAGMAIGGAVAGGTAGRVPYVGAGSVLADSAGLAYDATSALLSVNPVATGRVTLGALPPSPDYGGIWFGQSSPSDTNYSFLGRTGVTYLNAATTLDFKVGNVTMMSMNYPSFCAVMGYATGSSNVSGDTTLTVLPGNNNYRGLALQARGSQVAPLQAFQGISSTSTVRDVGYLDAGFVSNVDASYTGYVSLDAVDASGRRAGIKVQANGSVADVVIAIANVRVAANDAAAAALVPPIPVGCIYRSGSQLFIRVT